MNVFLPVDCAMAFMRTVSPMPSSTPSYAGASLLRHRYTLGNSSLGDRTITDRKKLLRISIIFNLKYTNLRYAAVFAIKSLYNSI